MGTDFQIDSRGVERRINTSTRKNHITLLALGALLSADSLEYFKDIATNADDMRHNLDDLFEELRTIEEILSEENAELMAYRNRIIQEWGEDV